MNLNIHLLSSSISFQFLMKPNKGNTTKNKQPQDFLIYLSFIPTFMIIILGKGTNNMLQVNKAVAAC